MKTNIIIYSAILFLLCNCESSQKKSIQREKVIDTDWYTLKLYDYCVGSNYAQPGIQYNFDSCASTVDLLTLIEPPHENEYLNLETVSIAEESPDKIFSYSFVIEDQAYDSIKATSDDIYAIVPVENKTIMDALSEFLNFVLTKRVNG